MNKQIRQRIIGVVLLLILAAVLSPLVFRTPAQIRTALNMEIPPAPAYQEVAVEPVVSAEVEEAARERIESDREAVVAAAEQPESRAEPPPETLSEKPVLETLTTPPPPTITAQDDPVLAGFVVQVGSFSQPDSAESLVVRLKDAGFRAYTETDSQNGKLLHRVMVGPEIRKADAERTRDRLANDSRFKLDGLVRIYAP